MYNNLYCILTTKNYKTIGLKVIFTVKFSLFTYVNKTMHNLRYITLTQCEPKCVRFYFIYIYLYTIYIFNIQYHLKPNGRQISKLESKLHICQYINYLTRTKERIPVLPVIGKIGLKLNFLL
jgi:hypothetical protein